MNSYQRRKINFPSKHSNKNPIKHNQKVENKKLRKKNSIR